MRKNSRQSQSSNEVPKGNKKKKFSKDKNKSKLFSNQMVKKLNASEGENEVVETYEHLKKWFEGFTSEHIEVPETDFDKIYKFKTQAKQIFDHESESYRNKNPKTIKRSDFEWMKTVIKKGTVADKIAAFTLLIQDSALYNLHHLNSMISMVKVGKKRECFMVIDNLVELFLNDLLPPNRKLIPFNLRPLDKLEQDPSRNRQLLLFWCFEDELKQTYQSFLNSLNQAAHDTVDSNKEKVVTAMYKLLAGHPEKEQVLLSNLVNKLGDPSQVIGSKVIYTLKKLLQEHSSMKLVVMNEVEKLIFRTNISKRAQYYGICFLSQFYLTADDSEVALNLIKIYFSMFKACIKEGEIDSRMMKALLTGVNRAYPFVQSGTASLNEHINTMYKVVHLAKFGVAVHALGLLHYADNRSDRFYTSLYKKLNDPLFATSRDQAVFLNLIFRALKEDKVVDRVKVFIKRLLQISFQLPVNLVCGVLFLVSQLIKMKMSKVRLPVAWNPDMTVKHEIEQKDILVDDDEDEDGVERYKDVDLEEPADSEVEVKELPEVKLNVRVPSVPSGSRASHVVNSKSNFRPSVRNPMFAGGDTCIFHELSRLVQHFHPTVALFSQKILAGKLISYSGDPLQDFTLVRFLDRFVFKNPKKSSSKGDSNFIQKRTYTPVGVKQLAVNSLEYLKQSKSSIPVDELFLYSYLQNKKESFVKKERDDDDNESVASDEFEEMISEMMVGKKKVKRKEDIDFADEIGQLVSTNKPKKGKRSDEDDDGDSDEDMSDGGGNDGDNDVDSGSILGEEFDGDELQDMGSDDEDLQGSDLEEELISKGKKKKFKDGSDLNKLFASAEEFSEILEKTGENKYSGKFDTTDNASVKQLKWEENRNHWLKGKKRPKKDKNNFVKRKKM